MVNPKYILVTTVVAISYVCGNIDITNDEAIAITDSIAAELESLVLSGKNGDGHARTSGGAMAVKHNAPSKTAKVINRLSQGNLKATKRLVAKIKRENPGITEAEIDDFLKNIDLTESLVKLFEKDCVIRIDFRVPHKRLVTNYVTLTLLTWRTRFARFDAPRGRSKARGRPLLPSARKVANVVHEITEIGDDDHTQLLFQAGQFLDHDLTLTPFVDFVAAAPEKCGECDAAEEHPECFPIPLTDTNPLRCLPFIRSADNNFRLGPREQLNQITGFLDASQVYGSEVEIAKSLRENSGTGRKLRSQENGKLLPVDSEPIGCNPNRDAGDQCFLAGDIRSTEQTGLTCMHTLWLQEHNRISDDLAAINPHWSDQRNYLETRRIVGALHQRFIYADWLPEIIGTDIMNYYGILEETNGYFQKYTRGRRCNPTLFTEFSTAAFRFGHSLINANFTVKTPGESQSNFELEGNFFNPSFLYNDPKRVFGILAGFADQPNLKLDRFIHNTLRNKLFEVVEGVAFDLAALNIQRGRDHGIPGYAVYRRVFNLSRVRTFDDLTGIMDPATIHALRSVYDDARDIDLFPGIVSEMTTSTNGIMGDLGAHILAKQFQKLKHCDRFFYSNQDRNPGFFTEGQLREIRSMKLSNIICHNSPDSQIQENVFMKPGQGNELQSCSGRAYLNLNLWREDPGTPEPSSDYGSDKKIRPPRCIPESDGSFDVGVFFRD